VSGLVCAATFTGSLDAELAATRLGAEGIRYFIFGAGPAGAYHPNAAVRVMVLAEDYDEARAILLEKGSS
jgi:hypothetical protein